ncbi:MAG: hypothetical protein O3B01_18340 [Planctomycetota bacterium]|nr:hypothetical protein [Planctomycetota bacterium]
MPGMEKGEPRNGVLKDLWEALEKEKNLRRIVVAVFLLGLGLKVFLFARVWVGGDQVGLMRVGIHFAEERTLLPTSKQMSGEGRIPGGLLQIILGVPLMIYPHYKSPIFLCGLLHLLSFFLFAGVTFRSMGLHFMVAFLAVYWLSPWALYHCALLWEPSYFYFFAALHMWACFSLREKRAFVPSVILGLLISSTPQVHAQFIVLWLATFLAYVMKHIKVHYPGIVVGLILGGLTLLPYFQFLAKPDSMQATTGTVHSVTPKISYLGRNLLKVYPPLKTFVYWTRYGSFDVGRILTKTIFFSQAWKDYDSLNSFLAILARCISYLAVASVLLSAAGSVVYFSTFFRRQWAEKKDHESPAGADWLARYCLFMLSAMFITSCLAPVSMQSWHMIVGLPAACVPVAYLIEKYWNHHHRACRVIFITFILLRVPVVCLIGTGHDWFRIGRPGVTVEEFNSKMPEKYRAKVSDENGR